LTCSSRNRNGSPLTVDSAFTCRFPKSDSRVFLPLGVAGGEYDMTRLRAWVGLTACALLSSASSAAAADLTTRSVPQRPIYVTAGGGPNILGTTAVAIRAARFNGSWAHAMQDASRSPLLQALVAPARTLTPMQKLAYVQSRVHNSVRWISDATEWGQHDYWASASETLAHGAGDMEDRAIVKMHALRALGFSPSDLWLTLARDRVGGPITVLTVRFAGRYYILDDTGGAPFLADSRLREFQPIFSFGSSTAWVHTRNAAAPPIRTASSATAPYARK
jgi:predicted transglutaminase-like cysteine proteinase